MDLVNWTCWYFAGVFLVNISLSAIAAATDLVKIRIVGKVG